MIKVSKNISVSDCLVISLKQKTEKTLIQILIIIRTYDSGILVAVNHK